MKTELKIILLIDVLVVALYMFFNPIQPEFEIALKWNIAIDVIVFIVNVALIGIVSIKIVKLIKEY